MDVCNEDDTKHAGAETEQLNLVITIYAAS